MERYAGRAKVCENGRHLEPNRGRGCWIGELWWEVEQYVELVRENEKKMID